MRQLTFETIYDRLSAKMQTMEDKLSAYEILQEYYKFTLPEPISFTGLITDDIYSYFYPSVYTHQNQRHSGKWAFVLPPNDFFLAYLETHISELASNHIIRWRQVQWFELVIYVSDVFDQSATLASFDILSRVYDAINAHYRDSQLEFFRLKFKAEFITYLQNQDVLVDFAASKPNFGSGHFSQTFEMAIKSFVDDIQSLFVDQFGNFLDVDLTS